MGSPLEDPDAWVEIGESVHRASFSPFDGIAVAPPRMDFAKIIQQKKRVVADMQRHFGYE